MYVDKNNELIQKKHELIRKADKEEDIAKKNALLKQISIVNKDIFQANINMLKKSASDTIGKDKENYTEKELKKIMRDKYNYYQKLAKESREIYAKLVEKKREAKDILKILNPKDKESVKKILEY